jgi:hypothetical protein
MKVHFATLACITLLSACEPRAVQIANDRCWDVKPGDSVAGKLTVVGIVDNSLTEGGSYVQNTACPAKTMGLAIPSGPMLDGYKRRMRADPPRFVDHQFLVTGRIFKNPGSGRLLIMAESLQPAP